MPGGLGSRLCCVGVMEGASKLRVSPLRQTRGLFSFGRDDGVQGWRTPAGDALGAVRDEEDGAGAVAEDALSGAAEGAEFEERAVRGTEDDEVRMLGAGMEDDLLGGVAGADDLGGVAAGTDLVGESVTEALAGIFRWQDVVLDDVEEAEFGGELGGDVGGDGEGVLGVVGEAYGTENLANLWRIGGDGGAFDDERGADGVARDVLCDGAEQQAVEAAAAVTADDDEVGRGDADVVKDRVDGGAVEDGGAERDA